MRKKIILEVGQRVAFSAAWLKSVSPGYAVAQLRGTVAAIDAELTRITPTQYVYVRWDGDAGPWQDDDGNDKPGKLVCANNLAKLGSARFADTHA